MRNINNGQEFWLMSLKTGNYLILYELTIPVERWTFKKTSVPNLYRVDNLPYIAGPLTVFNRTNIIPFDKRIILFFDKVSVLNLYLAGLITKDLLLQYIIDTYNFSLDFKDILNKQNLTRIANFFLKCIERNSWDGDTPANFIINDLSVSNNLHDLTILNTMVQRFKFSHQDITSISNIYGLIPNKLLLLPVDYIWPYFSTLYHNLIEYNTSYNILTSDYYAIDFANFICDYVILNMERTTIQILSHNYFSNMIQHSNIIQICIKYADTDKLEKFILKHNINMNHILSKDLYREFGYSRAHIESLIFTTIRYQTYQKYKLPLRFKEIIMLSNFEEFSLFYKELTYQFLLHFTESFIFKDITLIDENPEDSASGVRSKNCKAIQKYSNSKQCRYLFSEFSIVVSEKITSQNMLDLRTEIDKFLFRGIKDKLNSSMELNSVEKCFLERHSIL